MKSSRKIHGMGKYSFSYPRRLLPAIAIVLGILAVHSMARADTVYVCTYPAIEQFTSTGVGSAFTSSAFSPIDGMAFDASGNLYVANNFGSTIDKITPDGLVHFFASTGLAGPTGLAVDSSGNIYAVNAASDTIEKFTPGGVGSLFATLDLTPGFGPYGLAFDKTGNLYLACASTTFGIYTNGTIVKFTPGGVSSVFATGLNQPDGLAVDSSGNLYVANGSTNTIEKFTPDGVGTVFANTGLLYPQDLAFDSSGNLFVVCRGTSGSGAILEYTPNGLGSVFASLPGGGPFSIAIAPIPTGSLKVTISPAAAVTAGAQWLVDSGVAQASGAIVSNLPVGNHTVSFSPLNGWAMPASQSVAISSNVTTTVSVTYGQLTYTTNNGAINLTEYTGNGGAMVLPSSINGRPVTGILGDAFQFCQLTSVMIPSSVTNIAIEAFKYCGLTAIMVDTNNPAYSSSAGVLFDKSQTTLVAYPGGVAGSYAIPQSVTSIADEAFGWCTYLTGVTFGTNVTSIGHGAFFLCASLTSVTIPNNVISIGGTAFANCYNLASVYFGGNAPSPGSDVFSGDNNATVYYLPGTTGWGATFGGAPAVLWNPQATTFIADGTQFGFNISGPTNATIVVEACADLANPVWLPVSTNTLDSSGMSFFSDPQWANYISRFYRFRSP